MASPNRIIAITSPSRPMAWARVRGARSTRACTATGPLDDPAGQWTLIPVGFAISLIDAVEAAKTLQARHDPGKVPEALQAMADPAAALR